MASSSQEMEAELELEPEPEPEPEPKPKPVAVTGEHAEAKQDPWEYILRKYVLMLAMLVATVTYGVGFSPPGGVWQDNVDGHLAGESIVLTTTSLRYLVFFYCNAFALTSSVLVIVLFLLFFIQMVEKKDVWIRLKPLRMLMMLDMLSFMGAYAAGSCRDTFTTIYTSVLMAAAIFAYLTVQRVLVSCPEASDTDEISGFNRKRQQRHRKVLMLLSTFVVSITYAAGLNLPGGFWDNTEGGHRLGNAILSDGPRKARLVTFFVCNNMAFMASLLNIMLILSRKLHEQKLRSREMYGCMIVALLGLIGAYAAGSCSDAAATTYVLLLVHASWIGIAVVHVWLQPQYRRPTRPTQIRLPPHLSILLTRRMDMVQQQISRQSRSLLLLLITFATAITYQAGLDPPGGVWQDNRDGHLAGDPILFAMSATRYSIFFYCNSFTFVASLVTVVVLFQLKGLFTRIHIVESVMILELLALIIAYAAGACREVSTSLYVTALGGAVLFFVVIHVIFFTLEQDGTDFYVEQPKVEMKRKLLYLLATLSTAMTYQAGLTPPGGFWLQNDNASGHHAGEPVLLYNNPWHYKAFFYCNSVSFMLSITTMILLVSPVLYRPAIRSYALTLCTMTGLSCLMGAYATTVATQKYLATFIGIFVLVAFTFFVLVILLLIFFRRDRTAEAHEEHPMINSQEGELRWKEEEAQYVWRKHTMLLLLAILVAGITYQAGLDPPGGVWQSDDGHSAGGPVMLDNRRLCYLAFFYSNSTSFTVSIVLILLLLAHLRLINIGSYRRLIHRSVMINVLLVDLLALLVAYVAGSTRGNWRLLGYVASLVILVIAIIIIKIILFFVIPPPTSAEASDHS